jgi:UPF0755 protein
MKKRVGRFLVGFIALLALVWGGLCVWVMSFNEPGPLAETKTIVVEKGSSTKSIGALLAREGVVKSQLEFVVASRLSFAQSLLKAGEYTFTPQMSVQQVIQKLSGGDVVHRSLTIPEGLTVKQVRAIVEGDDGLTGPPLNFEEGALLPETYKYEYGTKRADLMREMARAMTAAVDEAWENRDPTLPLKDKNDLLTLASIVEKETGLEAELPLVASVYVNRLNQGMKLQADPTVIYGASNYDGNLTTAHMKEKQPYNTYVNFGLPPGPIANPGLKAIQASAHPAKTDYIFFVADGSGGHLFGKTYKEHQANVRKFLALLKAGKAKGVVIAKDAAPAPAAGQPEAKK